jgi:hypothetical protein
MTRPIADQEVRIAQELLTRARHAMEQIGGNITNENIALKHYMNVTWVSRPIAEDKPSEEELFGEFFNSEILS